MAGKTRLKLPRWRSRGWSSSTRGSPSIPLMSRAAQRSLERFIFTLFLHSTFSLLGSKQTFSLKGQKWAVVVVWSSGQHVCHLLWCSEFESRWSLQVFCVFGKNDNIQLEGLGGFIFKNEYFWYLIANFESYMFIIVEWNWSLNVIFGIFKVKALYLVFITINSFGYF